MLKRWKGHVDYIRIPVTHEPGKQGVPKTRKTPSSSHSSKASGGVGFWPVGRWADGPVDRALARASR